MLSPEHACCDMSILLLFCTSSSLEMKYSNIASDVIKAQYETLLQYYAIICSIPCYGMTEDRTFELLALDKYPGMQPYKFMHRNM